MTNTPTPPTPSYKFHVLLDEDRLIMAGSPSATDPRFLDVKKRFPLATLVSLTHDLPTFHLGYVLSADGATAARPPLAYIIPPDRLRLVQDWVGREYLSLLLEQTLRAGKGPPALTEALQQRDRQTIRGYAYLLINTLAAANISANLSGTVWTEIQANLHRGAAEHVEWADAITLRNSGAYDGVVHALSIRGFHSWDSTVQKYVKDSTVTLSADDTDAAKLFIAKI